MKTITLTEAVQHAVGRTIAEERRNDYTAFIVFNDGTAIGCASQYQEDLSEETPGAGIEPPTFNLYEAKELKMLSKSFWAF